MNEFNYDSYCGIYCGACDIMMTYKTGKKHKLASFFDESTIKKIHNKLGLNLDVNKPFSYKCKGCKTGILFVNCEFCKIRKCAIEKNIEHCIDCNEYPCGNINETKKGETLLPHLKINQMNMETIKKIGKDKWFEEQEEKWKCPDCKTSFSWYATQCSNCSKDLKKYSFKLSFLKSLFIKLIINLIPKKNKNI